MTKLFIDIETFGHKPEEKEIVLPTEADVKVGNLKDPQKIADKIAETLPVLQQEAKDKAATEFEKEWRGNALKSLASDIVCVSLAFDDAPVMNIYGGTEQELMNELQNVILDKIGAQFTMTTMVIAHNGKGFDFPFLRHRAIKYKMTHLFRVFDFDRYSNRAVDTQELWGGTDWRGYYSLANIAKFLGIPAKTDMSGDKVHDHFLNGEIDKIANYCGEDVDVLRKVYNALEM